jgi:hypothetical protein
MLQCKKSNGKFPQHMSCHSKWADAKQLRAVRAASHGHGRKDARSAIGQHSKRAGSQQLSDWAEPESPGNLSAALQNCFESVGLDAATSNLNTQGLCAAAVHTFERKMAMSWEPRCGGPWAVFPGEKNSLQNFGIIDRFADGKSLGNIASQALAVSRRRMRR